MLVRSAAISVALAVVLLAAPNLAAASLARCNQILKKGGGARNPVKLVRKLASPNPKMADIAYCRLARLGTPAVGPLLDSVGTTKRFRGVAHENPRSSIAQTQPAVGLIALYLVEAILTGGSGERALTPRPVPRLLHAEITDQEVLLALAAALYRSWWVVHAATSLPDLRAAGLHPLVGAPVTWL